MGGEGFGHRLRWARDEARLSQEELSARAGVSKSSVTRIEQGHEPGTAKAVALYEALVAELPGLSLEWFLMGHGDRIAGTPTDSASRVRRYDGPGAQIDPLAGAAPQETPADRSIFLRGS